MKKITLLIAAALIAGCSGENGKPEADADLYGTYELESIIAPQELDYDNDGDSSNDLMTEGQCYEDSWISFHDDGTFNESYSYCTKYGTGMQLSCQSETRSGTFERQGNSVITYCDECGVRTFTFDSKMQTLDRTDTEGSYACVDPSTSRWANRNGALSFKYKKYTHNDTDMGRTDEENENVNQTGGLLGSFSLMEYAIADGQDFNNDGYVSTNLMGESPCYSASRLTFFSNGTYEENESCCMVTEGSSVSLECDEEPLHGTYVRNGDKLILRNAEGEEYEFAYDAAANLLKRSNPAESYPVYNIETYSYSMVTGNVDYTYMKN